MLRVLLTRRWLAWLAVAALVGVACFFLGRWQWGRWEAKHALQTQISDNYNATPVSLASVLPSQTAPLPSARQWTQVRLEGSYDDAHRLLVRNRPNSGTYGYEVLVPFKLTAGGSVLVNRGWVPNGPNAATPPAMPASPGGPATVVGWLRPPEIDLARAPIPQQVSSINVSDVEEQTGLALYDGAYIRMRSESVPSGARPPRPAALEPPDQGTAAGINLSYAIQWWVAIVAVFALVLLRARREAIDTGEVTPRKEPRPKKVRIWDEEDA